jgi:ferredoxin-NADP reductase
VFTQVKVGVAVRTALGRVTTPLLPDDYLKLINPLWSARELRGRIVEVRRESRDSATLVIKPGWGFSFDYQPGQYVGIGVLVDGRWRWRSYSLTSVPRSTGARIITITVKAMPEGFLSTHLVGGVRTGTVVRLAAPRGDFTMSDPPPPSVLFLTAGSGITPVMSMLRTMLRRNQIGDTGGQERSDPGKISGGQERSDPGKMSGGQERSDPGKISGGQERSDPGKTDIVHLHSAPTIADALFNAELTELERTHPGYRLLTRATRVQGRLDLNRIGDEVPDWRDRHTWACGPDGLLDEAEKLWAANGIADRLHCERFAAVRTKNRGRGGVVTFARSGRTLNADAATSLMEAGEQSGILMPFGCRMGICHTCVVGLVQGRVRDMRTGAEHEPGSRVQTCISAASGDCVLDA